MMDYHGPWSCGCDLLLGIISGVCILPAVLFTHEHLLPRPAKTPAHPTVGPSPNELWPTAVAPGADGRSQREPWKAGMEKAVRESDRQLRVNEVSFATHYPLDVGMLGVLHALKSV